MRSASLGPTPCARPIIALSDSASARSSSRGDKRGQHVQRHARADILHRLQQAEPFALLGGGEAVEPDRVVGDFHLDHQRGMRAGGQLRQGR